MQNKDTGPERPRATATISEVAALLGIGRSTAYELAQAGKLPVPVLRLGRRVVVPRAALDRLLSGEQGSRHATDSDAA